LRRIGQSLSWVASAEGIPLPTSQPYCSQLLSHLGMLSRCQTISAQYLFNLRKTSFSTNKENVCDTREQDQLPNALNLDACSEKHALKHINLPPCPPLNLMQCSGQSLLESVMTGVRVNTLRLCSKHEQAPILCSFCRLAYSK